MTIEEKKTIREMQQILTKIDNKIPVFFNITQYTNMGLVRSQKKWGINAVGNKIEIGMNYFLTEKARKYLGVIL